MIWPQHLHVVLGAIKVHVILREKPKPFNNNTSLLYSALHQQKLYRNPLIPHEVLYIIIHTCVLDVNITILQNNKSFFSYYYYLVHKTENQNNSKNVGS